MRRAGVIIAAVGAAVVLAGAGVLWVLRDGEGPEVTAGRFLSAWGRMDVATMRGLTADSPADFDARFTRTRDEAGVLRQRFARTSTREDGDKAQVSYAAELTLAGNHVWKYQAKLPLAKRDGKWRVAWAPRIIHPELAEGQRLRTAWSRQDRAAVEDADGADLRDSPSGSVQQMAGTVGPASAEAAKKLGPPYRKGDQVGADGLQRQYERRLAGARAATIQIVAADGRAVKTVQRFEGQPGQPVRTTLDLRTQRAAAKAVQGVRKPASLVAVKPSTGEILAVANKPGGFNRAMMGQYPPGSTFKVVTAAALVAGGVDARTPVACPAKTNIGGRTFTNYKNEDFGTVPFKKAFAHSCNTTMARLSVGKLGEKRLSSVARQFGFNAPIIGGLPAARAVFPPSKDDTAFAAASFGQGEVLASPLNMASVAAAAANGTWRSPRLVDASLVSQALDAAGRQPEQPHRLEPEVKQALKTLMPAVVSEGTAKDVSFPAGTAGKTGTAEYGTGKGGKEPPTHAWFIGYRGDLAFAVIVEGGGTGAKRAAPIAADFLRSAG